MPPPIEPAPPAGIEVLLADHDVICRSALRRLIQGQGIRVVEAASELLLTRWIQQRPIRLLIVNPVIAGSAILEKLPYYLTLRPGVTFVLLCDALQAPSIRNELHAMGLTGYLEDAWTQPFDPIRIRRILSRIQTTPRARGP